MSNEEIIEKINANEYTWTPLEGFAFTLETGDETVWCNRDGGYASFKVFRTKGNDEWMVCSIPNRMQEIVDAIVQFAKIVKCELNAARVVEVKEVVREVPTVDLDLIAENMRIKSEIGVYEKILAREFNVKAS